MLVTLYLFHSFICKNKKKKEKNMRGDVGKRNVDGKSEDTNYAFSAATIHSPERKQTSTEAHIYFTGQTASLLFKRHSGDETVE